MQINTNSYVGKTSLTYQTPQKQQENKPAFDTLLSMQSNQNQVENQESQRANVVNLSEFGVSFDSEAGRTIRTAQIVSAIQQYAKENNMDVLKVNWQSANVSWHQSFASASSSEKKEMLENVLEVLESETAIQRGLYMGQTESPEHFEKRKNSAIDILNKILQEIKA